MNTFLSPVHYRLYNKILLQQAIVDELLELGEKYGLNLEGECSRLYGVSDNKPLEEMAGHSDLPGWLGGRIDQVEYKYAYAVTRLLDRHSESFSSIRNIAANNATNLAITLKEFPFDAASVFRTVEDSLLDEMSCDRVNKVLKQGAGEIIWIRTSCGHSRYWEEVGGDIRLYYELRDSWIEALAKELGFVFDKPDTNTYRIRAYNADK
jgi:hypothetical protein